jgi:hypothetical protein
MDCQFVYLGYALVQEVIAWIWTSFIRSLRLNWYAHVPCMICLHGTRFLQYMPWKLPELFGFCVITVNPRPREEVFFVPDVIQHFLQTNTNHCFCLFMSNIGTDIAEISCMFKSSIRICWRVPYERPSLPEISEMVSVRWRNFLHVFIHTTHGRTTSVYHNLQPKFPNI